MTQFNTDQLLALLQRREFYDWYFEGEFNDFVELGEESGITDEKIKKWLEKRLDKIKK